ncbi:MAG: hypothetical protein FWD06_02335 [Oscillospiraceae bacterium]|nr:hypothetical protein [Oscillospiraceae bacterium]
MKKILAICLAVALLAGLFVLPAGALSDWFPPTEEQTNEMRDAFIELIANYNANHGGTGRLTVTVENDGSQVLAHVTGQVIGATRAFSDDALPWLNDFRIHWDARLHGNVADGALIQARDITFLSNACVRTNGIAVSAYRVNTQGGRLVGDIYHPFGTIRIGGNAIVSGNLYVGGSIQILDEAMLTGNIYRERSESRWVGGTFVSGNATVHAYEIAGYITIEDYAIVNLENTHLLRNLYIHATANANFIDQLSGYILEERWTPANEQPWFAGRTYTIVGDVVVNLFMVSHNQTLTIPEGASLTARSFSASRLSIVVIEGSLIVTERIILNQANVAIYGTLCMRQVDVRHINRTTVTGPNRRQVRPAWQQTILGWFCW